MRGRSWAVGGILALALAGVATWLHHAPRPVPGNPVPPLVYLQAEPYPGSCAAWLGEELIVTWSERGRPGRIPFGSAVRPIPGASWVHELPEDRVLVVREGTHSERGDSTEPGIIAVTSPNPPNTVLEPGGGVAWVADLDHSGIHTLQRRMLDGSPQKYAVAHLNWAPTEIWAALGDDTFLASGNLFDLRRVRGDGSGAAPLPEHSGHLVAPVSEGGRWVTLQHKDTWSLAEVRWGDAPQILQEQPLPGRPVTLRADDDGPVALVAIRPRQLAVWWWRPEGVQITPLPWSTVHACLALRGSKVGVFGFGHTFALDRTTGRTWRP